MTAASQMPGSTAEFDALVALAQREHRAGRLTEAAAACHKILAIRPDVAETHNNLGVILAQQGNFDQALPWFEQAIPSSRDTPSAQTTWPISCSAKASSTRRPHTTRKPSPCDPILLDAHNNLGNIFWRQGKLADAAEHFERALALRPNLAESHNNLGIVLAQQNKFDQAQARFEQTLALRPDYAEAHNNLGNVLLSQGKLGEAASHYQQTLALRPDHAEAHNNLGIVLWRQGKLAEAAAHSEQALLLRPDFAEAHNNLGNVLLSQGNLDQALARFEQAIALRPDYAEAHNNLAGALRDQGQLAEAAAVYSQALALRPDLAEAELGLALCHLVAGDYAGAGPPTKRDCGSPAWYRSPICRAGPASLWRGAACCCWPSKAWAIRSISSAMLGFSKRSGLGGAGHSARAARLLASHPDVDELFIVGSADEWPAPILSSLAERPGVLGPTPRRFPLTFPISRLIPR